MSLENEIRSALFVDFDNIYIGLDKPENDAFAGDPVAWLDRLTNYGPAAGTDGAQRRILVRRCYLNPQSFGRFRSDMMRAGFQVVDCPPMTGRGKTSADIYMAIDILDTLEHTTHFDEFIIMSADADFTPVLLRLRSHNRRTIVATVGFASPAYRAAADHVIEVAEFLESLIQAPSEEAQAPVTSRREVTNELLTRMAARVGEVVEDRGEVPAQDLPPIYREFREFAKGEDWLGYGALRRLTAAIVAQSPGLSLLDGDPWSVSSAGADIFAPAQPVAAEAPRSPEDRAEIRRSVTDELVRLTEDSAQPLSFPFLAQRLRAVIQSRGAAGWESAGFANFGELIRTIAPTVGFEVSGIGVGYVFDPRRQADPRFGAPDPLSNLDPGLADLIKRISNATGAPRLSPSGYRILFTAIAKEVNANGYQMTRTSKAVRDRCIEISSGIPAEDRPQISRQHVNFVLQGLWFAGYRFKPEVDPREISRIYRNNILDLCDGVLLTLSDEEKSDVDFWLVFD